MRPGDIRETTAKTWGECYMCRRLYLLDDLFPVKSQDAADWRYVCPLCRDVTKRTPWEQRATMAKRMRDDAQQEIT